MYIHSHVHLASIISCVRHSLLETLWKRTLTNAAESTQMNVYMCSAAVIVALSCRRCRPPVLPNTSYCFQQLHRCCRRITVVSISVANSVANACYDVISKSFILQRCDAVSCWRPWATVLNLRKMRHAPLTTFCKVVVRQLTTNSPTPTPLTTKTNSITQMCTLWKSVWKQMPRFVCIVVCLRYLHMYWSFLC